LLYTEIPSKHEAQVLGDMLTSLNAHTIRCMVEIDVLIVPSLQSSAKKAAEIILNSNYDSVFLNFPKNLQPLVLECASRRLTPQEVQKRIEAERLIPEPVGSWFYLNLPLLEAIHKLGSNVKINCYKDVDHYHLQMDAASKIASLTLKASATGEIDVKEWIKTLKESAPSEASMIEAEYIAFKAYGKTVCVTGISGWKIANNIKRIGYPTRVKCVEKLYHFKPLEILENLLEAGKLTDEIAKKLIWDHVEFVRSYVLPSRSFDEAYQRWVLNKHKHSRLLLHVKTLE